MLPDGTQRDGDEGPVQGLAPGSEALRALEVELPAQAEGDDTLGPPPPRPEPGPAPELDPACDGAQHEYQLEI